MLTRPVNHMDQASGCGSDVDERRLPVQQPCKRLHHRSGKKREKERMKIWQLIAKDNVESLRLKATKKNTTNAQLIEMFCSKTCSRSFSDSLSIEFKNNVTVEGKKKEEEMRKLPLNTSAQNRAETKNMQRGKQES